MAEDKVNPKHYADLGEYSAVHIIRAWNEFRRGIPGASEIGFDVGNTLKYLQRAGMKPGESEIVDLKKAIWYLQERVHILDPSEPDPAEKMLVVAVPATTIRAHPELHGLMSFARRGRVIVEITDDITPHQGMDDLRVADQV